MSVSRSKYKMPPMKHTGGTTNPFWRNFQERMIKLRFEKCVLARPSRTCVINRRNSIVDI